MSFRIWFDVEDYLSSGWMVLHNATIYKKRIWGDPQAEILFLNEHEEWLVAAKNFEEWKRNKKVSNVKKYCIG